MSILNINGTDMPDPSELSVTVSDISSKNAGRNAAGDMLRDKITQKVKIVSTWNYLSNEQCSLLLSAVDGLYFSMTYPDPKSGTPLVKTMYVASRTAPVFRVQDGIPGWRGVSIEFIEK